MSRPNPEVVAELAAAYRARRLSRREFFQKLAFASGSLLLAQQIALEEGVAAEWEIYDWPDAQGQQVPTPAESIASGERRRPAELAAEWVKYPSGESEVAGYLARPQSGAPFASIIVIHENRGLTEFVLDIAQRWAGEGLLALAPDFLSRLGGTQSFDSMDAAREGIGRLRRDDVMADLAATVAYLQQRDDVRRDRIGVSGYCWGGAQTHYFATVSTEIAFAIPFYGSPPPFDRLDRITAPFFAVYAEDDARVNANMAEMEKRMRALGKRYDRRVYPGTQHAFMNFTNPGRYNAEQARAAWADATAFVREIVR
jgi:carboxymethylenebutenolidase